MSLPSAAYGSFGFKGGLYLSDLLNSKGGAYSAKLGPSVGLTILFPITRSIGIQPDLLIAEKWEYGYLEFPLQLRYDHHANRKHSVYFLGGGFLSTRLWRTGNDEYFGGHINNLIDWEWGIAAGAGTQRNRYSIEMGFFKGLTSPSLSLLGGGSGAGTITSMSFRVVFSVFL